MTQGFRTDKPAFDDPRPAYPFEQHPIDLTSYALLVVLESAHDRACIEIVCAWKWSSKTDCIAQSFKFARVDETQVSRKFSGNKHSIPNCLTVTKLTIVCDRLQRVC